MSHLQLHPMLVHFPLALTIVGTMFLWGARIARSQNAKNSLAAAGTWNFILSGITILLTLGSGLAAASHLNIHDAPQHSLSRHVLWAVSSSQLVVLLSIWRGAGKSTALPTWLFLSLAMIACGGLIVTGYWGGENVYHYGLGQQGMR